MTNQKEFVFWTTISRDTKVISVLTYGKGLLNKSHDHLNKWLCEVTLKTTNIKYDLSQYLKS